MCYIRQWTNGGAFIETRVKRNKLWDNDQSRRFNFLRIFAHRFIDH